MHARAGPTLRTAVWLTRPHMMQALVRAITTDLSPHTHTPQPHSVLSCMSCSPCLALVVQTQGEGLSRKERMMRALGLNTKTDAELAEEVQQLQDDFDDDD